MNETLDRDLIAAAWRNDVEEAARLIAQGADVNATDASVQSAYLIATSEGFLSLLALTLDNGADVTAKDSYNGTGLIRAAERGHALTVGMLLRSGIEVDHVNNLGWTALHEAIILGDGGQRFADTVRLLLAGGANPALPSQGDGVSPLEHAASRGYDVIATSLQAAMESGSPQDATAALFAAAGNGDADGAMLALGAGADPAARDAAGDTALARDVSDRWLVCEALSTLAELAGECGRAEVGARLFGAEEAVRETAGLDMNDPARVAHAPGIAGVRAHLGDQVFASSWAAGRALPLDEAVSEALALEIVPETDPAARRGGAGHHMGLTPRERDVLRLLVAGRSNPEIAEALYISRRTVTSHVEHIFAKLGVRTRAEAANSAREHGLS